MADRTSAALFGKIFELLAKNPTDEHKQIATNRLSAVAPETLLPIALGRAIAESQCCPKCGYNFKFKNKIYGSYLLSR